MQIKMPSNTLFIAGEDTESDRVSFHVHEQPRSVKK